MILNTLVDDSPSFLVTAFREHQELAVFLALGIGFAIGRLRFGSSPWS